ncbi:Nuclear receptor coactivator 4 [Oryzias melastigma]|uniref:Nuclear receptor coactivator 4 n=1 Tax=Oryzias melastigma TaxID=30732 RepID=A0A834CSV1_ORYME|nr:Nuclear receptor coactivator 4 [Oryzias melastigma]
MDRYVGSFPVEDRSLDEQMEQLNLQLRSLKILPPCTGCPCPPPGPLRPSLPLSSLSRAAPTPSSTAMFSEEGTPEQLLYLPAVGTSSQRPGFSSAVHEPGPNQNRLLMISTKTHNKGARMAAAPAGLKQCQQAQEQLDSAISCVLRAEQQLRENAREVRLELQNCVSRQQEALRCREVWLLGQIELLEQVKSETLQHQLQQLHRLRGQFDLISPLLQSSSGSDLSRQLSSCMERLSSLSLTPEETPEMSFHADTRSLRHAITSFGSITAQVEEAGSNQSAVLQRGQVHPSTNQQTESATWSEWLLGASPAGSSSSPPHFQPSSDLQDWLQTGQDSKTSSPVLGHADFLQAWGQLLDLEVWLLQDQNRVSRERTISSSSSSTFSIEKIDESEFSSPEEEEEGDLGDWLVTPPLAASDGLSDAERWRSVLRPFQDGWVSSEWLVEAGPSAPSCNSCCQSSSAVEIENLGQLKCLKSPPAPVSASPCPHSRGVASAGGAAAADLQGQRAVLLLLRVRLRRQLWEGGAEPLAAEAGGAGQERRPANQEQLRPPAAQGARTQGSGHFRGVAPPQHLQSSAHLVSIPVSSKSGRLGCS